MARSHPLVHVLDIGPDYFSVTSRGREEAVRALEAVKQRRGTPGVGRRKTG
jgi:hypothetical protein